MTKKDQTKMWKNSHLLKKNLLKVSRCLDHFNIRNEGKGGLVKACSGLGHRKYTFVLDLE